MPKLNTWTGAHTNAAEQSCGGEERLESPRGKEEGES